MLVKQLVFFFFSLVSQFQKSSSQSLNFIYNGFRPPLTDISIQGIAAVTPNGLLQLTNATTRKTGHAFYTKPIRFKDSPNGNRLVLLHNLCLRHQPSSAPVIGGLGMPLSSLLSPASLVSDAGLDRLRWSFASNRCDDGSVQEDKPRKPLVSTVKDLSSVLLQDMFVGFSSSTALIISSDHFVLGWSFAVKGKAPPLALSKLPKIPRFGPTKIQRFYKNGMVYSLVLIPVLFISSRIPGAIHCEGEGGVRGGDRRLGNRVRQDSVEVQGLVLRHQRVQGEGPSRIRRVWERLQRCHAKTKKKIAVKRVSNESRQGLKEFVSEIVSIGRMSHRNLVPLLGYCRRKTSFF
ncbi:unnamed protein product [Microthlaspi erraticum]|uniref:Legume lectin domain-containing protein n=1 Tax=Microthlaspi erraticum TaxID=1685480 RepID=A0A6D2IWZ8_9BRAS|nr:unnamed protein product [Microthlaspi erraticum]